MILKMDPLTPPIESTEGGATFFVSGGRALVRQRITPVRPQSRHQQVEVSGVTAAMKYWSNGLDTPARALWNAMAPGNLTGLPWWVQLWSFWNWIVPMIPPLLPPFIALDPPDVDDFVVDSTAGTIGLSVSVAAPIGDEICYVALSPPGSPGRMPNAQSTRTIKHALTLPCVVDLAGLYVERFGALPVAGQLVYGVLLMGSPSAGAVAPFVEFSARDGHVPVDTASVTPSTGVIQIGSTRGLTLAAFFDDGLTSVVIVSGWDAAFQWQGLGVLPNGGSIFGLLKAVMPPFGPHAFNVVFTSQQTAATISVAVTFTIVM